MNKENFEKVLEKILELEKLKDIISNIEEYCEETIKYNEKELKSSPLDEIDRSLENEISVLTTILKIIK